MFGNYDLVLTFDLFFAIIINRLFSESVCEAQNTKRRKISKWENILAQTASVERPVSH